MLPEPIADELWSIQYHVSDVALDYLIEGFTTFGFQIVSLNDLDSAIYLAFRLRDVLCELRVDRIAKSFTLNATGNVGTWIPVTGDWEVVLGAVRSLLGQHKHVVTG